MVVGLSGMVVGVNVAVESDMVFRVNVIVESEMVVGVTVVKTLIYMLMLRRQ